MLEIITSILGGGLTGLLGSIFTAWNKRKMMILQNEDKKDSRLHDREMVKIESDAAIAEVQANIQRDKIKFDALQDIEATQAFKESLKQGNQNLFGKEWMAMLLDSGKYGKFWAVHLAVVMGITDTIRMLVRPGLTTYTVWLLSYCTFTAWAIVQSAGPDPTQALDYTNPEHVKLAIEMLKIGGEPVAYFTPAQAYALLRDTLIPLICYLTSSVVLWWFGERLAGKALDSFYGKGTQ